MASISVAALVVMGVSAAGAAYESHAQGVAISNENKMKARVEADSERAKQIQIRQNMLRALASQNAASLGAIGTGGASSFGANVTRQLNQEQNDLMINSANSSAQVSLLDMQGRNAVSSGNVQAGLDLASGASKMMDASSS